MAQTLTLNDYSTASTQSGLFSRLREKVVGYRKYLAIQEELQLLSDRELADIGISRFNIPDIARDAARTA